MRVESFNEVHAYATGGGEDEAKLYDSAGDDSFYASPTEGALYGDGFYNRAKSFEKVTAFANTEAGGSDVALLYDSPLNDSFKFTAGETPAYAEMVSGQAGFNNRVESFEEVYAYSSTGTDGAELYDSPGDDEFVATPTYAGLFGDGFSVHVESFGLVHAHAVSGGNDTAKLYDSPEDDTFTGSPVEASLSRTGFFSNVAHYFEAVHVYSNPEVSDYDVAELHDSFIREQGQPPVDVEVEFYGHPTESAMYGDVPDSYNDRFFNRVKYFEEVHAHATIGGGDEANLWDSDAVDLLEVEGDWARLSNASLDFLFKV
jgi:hypothetical protein